MATSFYEFMAAGDAHAREQLGQDAVFSAGVLPYAAARIILLPAMAEMVYAAGGAELTVKHVATVSKADMARAPQQGDSVTVAGERYYVTAVEAPAYSPIYRMTLAS